MIELMQQVFELRLPERMGGLKITAPARERVITEEEWDEYQSRDEYDQPVNYEIALFSEWIPVYATNTGATYFETDQTGIVYIEGPRNVYK